MARAGVPLVEVLRLPGFSFDDLPPDAPEHEVAESHQSRLGKGLAAIMPGAEVSAPRRTAGGLASVIPLGPDAGPQDQDLELAAPAAAPAPGTAVPAPGPRTVADAPRAETSAGQPLTEVDAAAPPALDPTSTRLVTRLHGDLVTALLDGLAAETAVELVAYVHQPDRGAPRLHLGRPSLAELTADRCFDLCVAMDGLTRSRPGVVVPFSAGGFEGVSIVVAGTGSRGLWVAARSGRPMDPVEVDAAVDYARNTGAAATLLDLAGCAAPAEAPHVEVRVAEGQVVAEVHLSAGGATLGAPTGVEAAARATLEAVGSDAEFLYAAAARDEDTAASLVLVRQHGRVGVGCAAGSAEAPALTATATLRATGHHPSSG